MRISNRKFAITGASRGLGAALAVKMADAGAQLVLLARTIDALQGTMDAILERTGQQVSGIACDLANSESATAAGQKLASEHPDLDGIIHNGATWLSGPLSDMSDLDIQSCIGSAAIGSLILTRHLMPILEARKDADIHVVVSTSGLHNQSLDGDSIVFKAAKSAQAGLVQGLSDELANSNVRVTAVYPGDFNDVSPINSRWNEPPKSDDMLSNREVVEAIFFILNLPPKVAVRSLVIE